MKPTEQQAHEAILDYLRLRYPRALIHHSPNENALSFLDRRAAARISAKNKRLGMVKGFPDLLVIHPGPIVWAFEVKSPNGRQSPEQRWLESVLREIGVQYGVVRSIDEVQDAIAEWTQDGGAVAFVPLVGTIR